MPPLSTTSPDLDRIHKPARDRKREVYWTGFLDGVLAAGHVTLAAEEALKAEAEAFLPFFDDSDAAAAAEQLQAQCFSGQNDITGALERLAEHRRAALTAASAYTEKDEVNDFLGLCAGAICDGMIGTAEARMLLSRIRNSDALPRSVAFHDLWRMLEAALAGPELSPKAAEDLRAQIARLVGDGFADTGVTAIGHVAQLDQPITDPAELIIAGRSFVLTGPMRMGRRADIIAEIQAHGGHVAGFTSRKTHYVVVSSMASRNWRSTHFGTKIEKAKALIDQGYGLRFVHESALERALRAG